jgi:hypothetical protein
MEGSQPSYEELRQLTERQAQQLREQQRQLDLLEGARRLLSVEPSPAVVRQGELPLPPGPYNATCTRCSRFGDSLWCDCLRDSTRKWEQSALTLSSCRGGANATVTAPGGFLSCDWRPAPPPRVGNLTAGKASERCRYVPHTSFVAPEFKHPGDPLATVVLNTSWPWHDAGSAEDRDVESEQEARACCKLCKARRGCKGGTSTTAGEPPPPAQPCATPPCPPAERGHRVCQLVSQTATAAASLTSYSGYPITSDAASWCESNQANLNVGVPPGVRCGSLAPRANASGSAADFPRAWATLGGPRAGGGGRRRIERGRAWLFYPCGGGGDGAACLGATSCSCRHRRRC